MPEIRPLPARLNRWTLLERLGGRPAYLLLRCDCGTVKRVRRDHYVLGKSMSCGCLHSELSSARAPRLHQRNITHGKTGTRAHGIWLDMKQRCHNTKATGYASYGGRGIAVCPRWRESFQNFLADMGEPPDGMTLDRVDNNRGYEPTNCRWVSRFAQGQNTRATRIIEIGGIAHTISEWAAIAGISRKTLSERLRRGVVGRALIAPAHQHWG